MHGAGGDEEVVMLFRGPYIDVFLGIESRATGGGLFEFGKHRLGIDILPESEIDLRTWRRIQHIIAFVLCIIKSEFFPDVRGIGMHL